jgi:hypothetical protein
MLFLLISNLKIYIKYNLEIYFTKYITILLVLVIYILPFLLLFLFFLFLFLFFKEEKAKQLKYIILKIFH